MGERVVTAKRTVRLIFLFFQRLATVCAHEAVA